MGRDRRLNVVILECFICRWERDKMGRWEKWEGSEVARWERWEGNEVERGHKTQVGLILPLGRQSKHV